jgi:hypothetical protein
MKKAAKVFATGATGGDDDTGRYVADALRRLGVPVRARVQMEREIRNEG